MLCYTLRMSLLITRITRSALSQGGPRDAAANFDRYQILQRNFCLFLEEGRFGRSRSSKVIEFAANRNSVCDFLLVRHSHLGAILHRFGDFGRFLCS